MVLATLWTLKFNFPKIMKIGHVSAFVIVLPNNNLLFVYDIGIIFK